MKRHVLYQAIQYRLRQQLNKLPADLREIVLDEYHRCLSALKTGQHSVAQHLYIRLSTVFPEFQTKKLKALFSILMNVDDMVTEESTLLVSEESNFYLAFLELHEKFPRLNISNQKIKVKGDENNYWMRDFCVSLGNRLFHPYMAVPRNNLLQKLLNVNIPEIIQSNPGVYRHLKQKIKYPIPLSINYNFYNRKIGGNSCYPRALPLNGVSLEGGNFFCAYNKNGEKKYIIGEAALVETMAILGKNKGRFKTSAEIKKLYAEYLDVDVKDIIIIPQWTYHIDLQMAYLGEGRFIVHSFDQQDFDFFKKNKVKMRDQLCKETFAFLKKHCEVSIIDRIIKKLSNHGFSVNKVFGCLFYMTSTLVPDPNQLVNIRYCKNDGYFGGAVAQLMNDVPMKMYGKIYYQTAYCENRKFREQFEQQLRKMNVEVIYLKIKDPSFYKTGKFQTTLERNNIKKTINSHVQFFAAQNGGLRCQTATFLKNLPYPEEDYALVRKKRRNST